MTSNPELKPRYVPAPKPADELPQGPWKWVLDMGPEPSGPDHYTVEWKSSRFRYKKVHHDVHHEEGDDWRVSHS